MKLSMIKRLLAAAGLAASVLVGAVWGQTWTPVPSPGPWPASRPAGPAPSMMVQVEAMIYRFTNEIRARHNFAPLTRDEALEALARGYCQDMLQRRFFSHYTPEGLAPKDRVMPFYPRPIYHLGENIWKGFDQYLNSPELLARFIVDGWMSSPGHRDNIFTPEFTHLGIGVAVLGRDIRAAQIFVNLKGKMP
jgi:uncharacterized protein YkwD